MDRKTVIEKRDKLVAAATVLKEATDKLISLSLRNNRLNNDDPFISL